MNLLLATNNNGKLVEVKSLLNSLNILVKNPADIGIDFEVEETGVTFAENAAIKSEYLFKLSGIPSFADDSGLCVNALGGDPGVYSARYGKPEFNDKEKALYLLNNLEGKLDRTCYYFCSIAYTDSTGTKFFEAKCDGLIAKSYDEKGKFGFGYDPIFYYPPFRDNFSQVPTVEKNKISHRGLALQLFIKYIKENSIKI
jgi:XTP/dITP diphosphohydrolase